MTDPRAANLPVTHAPHTIAVTFRHDSLNMLVAVAICGEGKCPIVAHWPNNPPWNGLTLAERYRAAGMECYDYTPSSDLQFWDHQEVHRLMAHLKLAQHEGRQKTIDWARGELVRIARTRRPQL